jgi:signal transduction histidine kinase
VYFALVAVVVAFFASSSVLFVLHRGGAREDALLAAASRLAALVVPPSEAPPEERAARIAEMSRALGVGVSLFDAEGQRLAEAGRFAPMPDLDREGSHLAGGPPHDALLLRLEDGRWLSVRMPPAPHRHAGFFASLALLAVLLALAAWPLARSLARRIEALTVSVDAFGSGELGARAAVRGKDEVARLAERFNAAAERIETLVATQRTLLASASHALRSPLARLRVAAELLTATPAPEAQRAEALRDQLALEVASLDAAVEELLAVSRLELGGAAPVPVDLLALAAEEGARVGAEVSGEPTTALGDARSLRHLLRNLLENAKRYGGGGIEVSVVPLAEEAGAGARITVADRGPGVPDAERERIFEPFVTGVGSEGTGLGLAIVRQFARHHGGEVNARPREGGGTLLEVTLRSGDGV